MAKNACGAHCVHTWFLVLMELSTKWRWYCRPGPGANPRKDRAHRGNGARGSNVAAVNCRPGLSKSLGTRSKRSCPRSLVLEGANLNVKPVWLPPHSDYSWAQPQPGKTDSVNQRFNQTRTKPKNKTQSHGQATRTRAPAPASAAPSAPYPARFPAGEACGGLQHRLKQSPRPPPPSTAPHTRPAKSDAARPRALGPRCSTPRNASEVPAKATGEVGLAVWGP